MPKPLFQSEVNCETIDRKMIFYSQANRTHFPKKGFAPRFESANLLEVGKGLLGLLLPKTSRGFRKMFLKGQQKQSERWKLEKKWHHSENGPPF